ncbi:MAG: hypothetical protein A2Z14_06160 [Chloroflexi bacterium RBG_16_48_8]|nr:MAG: hypothetical protein A2Z14_06160 [Chloroflexi bacterium RBG_16_48_8]
MLKKIVLGTVFVVFVGALVTGAVIRTMDKTEQTASTTGSGRGNGENASIENEGISGGQGNGQGSGRSAESGNEVATTGRGKGGKGGEGSELLAEENSDHVWEPYSGVVTDVSEDILTIETDDGESIVVEGRAWAYAQDLGFAIQQGDLVQFEGFFEDDEFKVIWMENLTTSEPIVLRDASGRPSWAGGGKGNL